MCADNGLEGSIGDGYSWINYADKDILCAKFLRRYVDEHGEDIWICRGWYETRLTMQMLLCFSTRADKDKLFMTNDVEFILESECRFCALDKATRTVNSCWNQNADSIKPKSLLILTSVRNPVCGERVGWFVNTDPAAMLKNAKVSHIRLFIKGKKHGRMMLDSIDNGPLVYPTVEEDGHTRLKKYFKLTEAQQLQDDCDVQATNIILHGLPPDVGIATTSRGNYTAGLAKVVKCYNYLGEGHIAKQCTQPKRPRNYAWFKENLMLVKVQEAAFQIKNLDAYDLDFNDISSAKAVLMENLSSCDLDVLSERIKPSLYDGSVIFKEHDMISMIDDEETLILEEESRLKTLDKQNDPVLIKQKINISLIDYSKLNKIKDDFSKCFVTKKELSPEQAFWLKHSNYTPIKSHTPVRIKAPSKIPKTCVQSNEHSASLIAQINEKSVENSNLNAQLQEKVFAIAALKNELRKLKGKNVDNTGVSKPSATIAPRMFKLDIEPISHRIKNNR
nr:hypothetical protein [Tanacetum cinerariifolium]